MERDRTATGRVVQLLDTPQTEPGMTGRTLNAPVVAIYSFLA